MIDGERVAAGNGATLDIVDPATGDVIAQAAAGTVDDVDRAARSARAAFEDGRWRNLAADGQGEGPAQHGGDSWPSAASCSPRSTCSTPACCARTPGSSSSSPSTGLEYFSGWPSKLQGSDPAVPDEFNVYQVREPIGVVGLIMPWNGPTAVFAMVAAALAAGNSVILKPAEQTPMAAVLMAELAVEAGLPPGVFNVVQGYGRDVGQALVEHPDVDAISFTGSVATGSAIQAAAASASSGCRSSSAARARSSSSPTPTSTSPRRRRWPPCGAPRARCAPAAPGCSCTTRSTTTGSTASSTAPRT